MFYNQHTPPTLPLMGSNLVELPAMELLSVENFSETKLS